MFKMIFSLICLMAVSLVNAAPENLNAHHEDEEAVSTRAQVEEVIKNYLDSHPQAVYQALIKYRNQEMAKQETLSKPAVDGIKHTPEVEDTKLGARFAVNSNQNTTYNRVLQAITNNK